jgi:hypothetical protein
LDVREQGTLHRLVGEEGAAGPCITDPDAAIDEAEAPLGRGVIAADDDDRPRAHMLFLTHHLRDALPPVIPKHLNRIFESIWRIARVWR